MFEDGVQARAIGDLYKVLAETDNVTQHTEEQNADSHNLCCYGNRRILAFPVTIYDIR